MRVLGVCFDSTRAITSRRVSLSDDAARDTATPLVQPLSFKQYVKNAERLSSAF